MSYLKTNAESCDGYKRPVCIISVKGKKGFNNCDGKASDYYEMISVVCECTADMDFNYCSFEVMMDRYVLEKLHKYCSMGDKVEVRFGYLAQEDNFKPDKSGSGTYYFFKNIGGDSNDELVGLVFSGYVSKVVVSQKEEMFSRFFVKYECYDTSEGYKHIEKDRDLKVKDGRIQMGELFKYKGWKGIDAEGKSDSKDIKITWNKESNPLEKIDDLSKFKVIFKDSPYLGYVDSRGKLVCASFESLGKSSSVVSIDMFGNDSDSAYVKSLAFSHSYTMPERLVDIEVNVDKENKTEEKPKLKDNVDYFKIGTSDIKLERIGETVYKYKIPGGGKYKGEEHFKIKMTHEAMRVIKGKLALDCIVPCVRVGKFISVNEIMVDKDISDSGPEGNKKDYLVTKVRHELNAEFNFAETTCVFVATPSAG